MIEVSRVLQVHEGRFFKVFTSRKQFRYKWDYKAVCVKAAEDYFHSQWSEITLKRRFKDLLDRRVLIVGAFVQVAKMPPREYENVFGLDRSTIFHALTNHQNRMSVPSWEEYREDFARFCEFLKQRINNYHNE